MDENTATQLAAEKIVEDLGAAAGFMIALRILESIARRVAPNEALLAAFEAAVRSMEKFAVEAGIAGKDAAATRSN